MNTAQLAELIRVEVRNAIREELAELLQEAVRVASTPDNAVQSQPVLTQKPVKLAEGTRVPLESLLNETKLNFTSADAKSFLGASQRELLNGDYQSTPATAMANKLGMLSQDNMPGIDISQLPFLKKAKQVFDKSIEKDRERLS